MERKFCCYCERELFFKEDITIDHIIPASKGGNNSRQNKKTCCVSCNQLKRDFYPEQFLLFINARLKSLLKRYNNFIPNGIVDKKRTEYKIIIGNVSEIICHVNEKKTELFTNKYFYEHYLDTRNTMPKKYR